MLKQPNISAYSQKEEKDIYRIKFISGDSGSPFWSNVKKGAQNVAEKNHVAIEFLETFQGDSFGYLKNIDMAISSQVDGIIVQGKEDPEFIEIVDKALQKGIPVITVFTDAPESLRKTYVGPNHYQEGEIMGEYIAAELNGKGKIGIVYGGASTDYLNLRKKGIINALAKYPNIDILGANNNNLDDLKGLKETTNLLNHNPDCRVFLGLTSDATNGIVQSIRGRGQLKDYSIYSFDQDPEISEFLKEGIVSAVLTQQPEEIGTKSTILMLNWLDGKEMPLEQNYYTNIHLLKKGNTP
ncbi:substrate-binding domain-containing protein [Bacillus sp. FJAT-29814]|uniref:sugar ABC transporter substrate-binding protein n=1 Tax=Bacillus sp. FJAT-29814 TaxID=1729688 RepID=UPI000A4E55A1|nr:substrate-binding domain-containing protein [Bacillus sp. FJAT-29814]